MSGPVERGRRLSGATLTPEQAKAETTRAVMLYAMLEAPAALALAGALAWLFAFDNGLSADDQTVWAVVAMIAFVLYAGALFFTLVLPATRRHKAAREAVGQR